MKYIDMLDRIPTLDELLNWSNDTAERKNKGENVSELEYKAAVAIFEFALMEAYKQNPLSVYALVTKRMLEDLKDE